MKLSPAIIRALEATESNKTYRVYMRGGNIFRGPKGVGSISLQRALAMKLIAESKTTRFAGFETRIPLILTDDGKRAIGKS